MIRVRFAPSPTGNLHIGGARTALFNYLFARHNNGKFILRIEDTDALRSKKEYEDNILNSIKWLKMDWDEFYRQSERMNIYFDYAKKLFAKEKAYRCFCTKEELEEKRKLCEMEKKSYKYDGKCRKLTKEEVKRLEDSGTPYSIRFKITPGETEINDLIRGKITFDNNELDDMVILRTDCIPTYNFCVVIDDALMEITHIIRGEDHISNTPRQCLLYKALGFKVPEFAHLPLILGANKSRLSKREGAVSVTKYKDKGYLSDAVINFLALLGCSYGSNKQILKLDELIMNFSLERVNKSPAVFDMDKLDWINGYYIRQKHDDELVNLVKPYLKKENILVLEEKIKQVIKLEKERLKKLADILDSKFFFSDNLSYDKTAVDKYFKNPATIKLLKEYTEELKDLQTFTSVSLEKFSRDFVEKKNLKLKDLVHPVRLALTGKLVSPGLFEVMEVLGRETCLKRLKILPN